LIYTVNLSGVQVALRCKFCGSYSVKVVKVEPAQMMGARLKRYSLQCLEPNCGKTHPRRLSNSTEVFEDGKRVDG